MRAPYPRSAFASLLGSGAGSRSVLLAALLLGRRFGFAALATAVGASVACSSSPGAVHATFQGIIAGSDMNGPVTGSLTMRVDGSTAMASMAFASTSSTNSLPATTMAGSASGNSYTMASADGQWTMSGSVSGSKTNGSMKGPNSMSANFSAEDTSHGAPTLYCGTYSGSDSGTWNLVVSSTGEVSGAFAGSTLGNISGSGNGQSVSFTWSGPNPLGGNISGTAQGTVQGGTVTGSWSGSGYSGMFTSNQSCPSAPVLPSVDGGSDVGGAGSGGGVSGSSGSGVGGSNGAGTSSGVVGGGSSSGSTPPSCVASGGVCNTPASCCSGQCYSQGSSYFCY